MSKSKLVGDPFLHASPPREGGDNAPPARDARQFSLRTLADYISELSFVLPSGEKFGILREHIYIDPPEAFNPLVLPAIGMLPGKGVYESVGLGTVLDERSAHVFKKGTVLQVLSDYQETIQLEIWAEKPAARASIMAGLEWAMQPTEALAGIRFRMPDYYDQTCTFTFQDRLNNDDQFGQNRSKVFVSVFLYVDVVRLVHIEDLKPFITTDADVPELEE